MKKCRKCGEYFSDANTLCPDCGEMLVAVGTEEKEKTDSVPAAPAVLPASSKGFGTLGIVSAVIGGIIALLFVIRGNIAGAALALAALVSGAFGALLLLRPDLASKAKASGAEKKNDGKTTRLAGILLSVFAFILAAVQICSLVLQVLSQMNPQ